MPPVADKTWLVPSVPVKVTCVEFVAATVKMEELPAMIAVGLAEMVTVGAGFLVTVTVAFEITVPAAPAAEAE